MSPKKVALWFLIGSVAISAALGIIAILTGNFGDFEIRIILTTLTISGASVGALASGALWEAQGKRELPLLGIVLAVAAALLLITGIWLDTLGVEYWKFTASTGVLAAATAHACLLSLAKLAPRFAWTRLLTLAAVYALAALVIMTIYFEPSSDLRLRLIGTVSIVVAALTIMTPIFHRLSRDEIRSDAGVDTKLGRGLWATITCPNCGAGEPNSLTETTCNKCGCRFIVKILAEGNSP